MELTAKQAAAKAIELVNHLVKDNAFHCNQQKNADAESCLRKEGQRPLTRAEIKSGYVYRSFDNYNLDALCLPCRCYWLQVRASNALDRLVVLQAREAVECESKK
jgi:hypothetical protein